MTQKNVYTYIQKYTHTYIFTFIHVYIHTCRHTYIRTYMHACMHNDMIHTYIYTMKNMRTHTWIHTYSYMYLMTYTCTQPRVWEAYWQLGTGATAGNSTHLPATRKMTVLFNNKNINSTTFEYVRWILVFGNSFLATRRLGVLSNQKRSSGRLLKFECVQ